MTEKKREITDWEKAECTALKAKLDAFNAGKSRKDSLSQGKIADALEISQGAVSSYLNGYNALNARVAGLMAKMIGIPVETFSPRLAAEIARIAQADPAVPTHTDTAPVGMNMAALQRLKGKVTPRSLEALQRIEKAALQGLLKEADLVVLEGIAARLEELNTKQP
ncbi:helix-turn-helix domain-containing protein [Azotobacter beijerinckii]|uniref:Helix-turn-helix n=1 Tax=Azotobacter beijerinckii TaxID=170623 RepID=A0A1I4EVV2_9GAMM|nr:helix-turn-helix transcriptional regulator [Azotobacter beijerinckii]SFB48584.1 Helix-turn-helix [Azotobacter beijerinckii]SFL09832.1 Helix-turn-helix [Azotobacter beijerinckii]